MKHLAFSMNPSHRKKELLTLKPGQSVQHLWCIHMSTLNMYGLFHFWPELRLADVRSINPLGQSFSCYKKLHVAQKTSNLYVTGNSILRYFKGNLR